MKLIKIGGVIFKTPEAVHNLVSYLRENQDEKLYLVFSAFDNTSALLKQAINFAAIGDYASALAKLNSIKNHHYNLANSTLQKQFFPNYEQILDRNLDNTVKLLKGISIIQDYSAKVADQILSLGEILVLEFINVLFLQEKFDFAILPAHQWLVANDNFTNAEAIKEEAEAHFFNMYNNVSNKSIFVSEGFLARTQNKEICTMGFESSNKTVMLISSFLKINSIKIISDVDGIYTADPKISLEAKHIDNVSFDFAIKLAENGIKLLYKPLLEFCRTNNIEISYTAFSKKANQSKILAEANEADVAIFNNRVAIISVKCHKAEECNKLFKLISADAHNILVNIDSIEFSTFADIAYLQRLLKQFDFSYDEKLTEVCIFGNVKKFSFSNEYHKYIYDAKEKRTLIWGKKSDLLHTLVNYG